MTKQEFLDKLNSKKLIVSPTGEPLSEYSLFSAIGIIGSEALLYIPPGLAKTVEILLKLSYDKKNKVFNNNFSRLIRIVPVVKNELLAENGGIETVWYLINEKYIYLSFGDSKSYIN